MNDSPSLQLVATLELLFLGDHGCNSHLFGSSLDSTNEIQEKKMNLTH